MTDGRGSIDLQEGESFADYKIHSLLGTGGMGHVYRATSPDGVEVALKLVKPDIARDYVFRKRFDREARAAQSVVNPHVVPVLDTGEHEGIPYLTQRLISGGSLADRLESGAPLDIAAAVRVCREVGSGLDALHAAGLVHRDVKPANIVLDEEGVAYITDLGLAKDTQGSLLTRPGQAVGSLDYMAPEQIRGEEVTASTDVYALGCVMWECAVGQPPFAERQGLRILWAHLQDQPADPGTKRPDLPPRYGAAILRALEKDPAQRPQTAGEFAEELAAASEG